MRARVEQRLTECFGIADRVYVMQTGRVLLRGTAMQVENDVNLRRAYLGP